MTGKVPGMGAAWCCIALAELAWGNEIETCVLTFNEVGFFELVILYGFGRWFVELVITLKHVPYLKYYHTTWIGWLGIFLRIPPIHHLLSPLFGSEYVWFTLSPHGGLSQIQMVWPDVIHRWIDGFKDQSKCNPQVIQAVTFWSPYVT